MLIKNIVENQIFVKVNSNFYLIKFQKRVVPHMHLRLILHAVSKIFTLDQIDEVVSAEITDLIFYIILYAMVQRHMIHEAC